MRIIMNGINGDYLQNIILNPSTAKNTEVVLAAVAYATDASLLFDWCWENSIPLKYYGRLDESIAVNTNILTSFLEKKSAKFICKLVRHHHAKVIWWRGVGMYIGSANLTNSAWNRNVEAGCFFLEEEINDDMAGDILDLFDTLEKNATPLNEEVLNEMEKRSRDLAKSVPDAANFWNSPSFKKWSGLITNVSKKPGDRKQDAFLEEWHATLQYLRDIGERVSQPEKRPPWVNATASPGAQADQFLHAHYYQRTFDGQKGIYEDFFEKNKTRNDEALTEAIEWWRKLPKAPGEEDEMMNVTAQFLQSALSEKSLEEMDEPAFRCICMRVHSIKDYARRVSNERVKLPAGTRYTISQKVEAHANYIWNSRSSTGKEVKELLKYILYGGSGEQLPIRLWQGFKDPEWKIDGLGISSLGEIVGWGLPDKFPPRNGRTSKALRSLGYKVTVHVG